MKETNKENGENKMNVVNEQILEVEARLENLRNENKVNTQEYKFNQDMLYFLENNISITL
jgi:hypothetical protein